MDRFDELRNDVLRMQLDGDHPVLEILRDQARTLVRQWTEMSGVGFFTHCVVSPDAPVVEGRPSFQIEEVIADVEGLRGEAGFILFVRRGRLDTLEGFTYAAEPWPSRDAAFKLRYVKSARDFSSLPQSHR